MDFIKNYNNILSGDNKKLSLKKKNFGNKSPLR